MKEWKDEWKNEGRDKWKNELKDEWKNECNNEKINERMNMTERMNSRMNERMNERINERKKNHFNSLKSSIILLYIYFTNKKAPELFKVNMSTSDDHLIFFGLIKLNITLISNCCFSFNCSARPEISSLLSFSVTRVTFWSISILHQSNRSIEDQLCHLW